MQLGRKQVAIFVALTVVSALGVTAGAGTSLAGTQATSASDVHIGVLGPMTGVYASVGAGFWQGANAAAAEINAQGGILGGKLVLDQGDDVDDPADAIPAINKLVGVDHVVGIVGPASTVLPVVEPIMTENKIPTMFQGGTTTFDTNTNPWIWRPSPSDNQLGVAMATYALMKHYKRAAMMFTSVATAQTLKGVVEQTYKKNGGRIVSSVTIQSGATSYRSEVQKVVRSNPQIIFTQVDEGSAGALFKSFAQLNKLAIPFLGSDLTAGSDVIGAITPAVAHKSLVSIEASTSSGPGVAAFTQWYGSLYSGAPISGANYSYDSVMELALAMQKANSTSGPVYNAKIGAVTSPNGVPVSTWAQATTALKANKTIHFVGAGGPTGFDKHHNALGAFAAFRSSASSPHQKLVAAIPSSAIAAATSGKLRP
jgi:branched-chain amino acid transport system substrate-binding protein